MTTPAPAPPTLYFLDANVFIQAYRGYYSFALSPSYWTTLDELGVQGRIFIPRQIATELDAKDDDLCTWIKGCRISITETDARVIQCWKDMLAAHPNHKYLVNSAKGRSEGDPWLISHAMAAGGVVVSKENRTMSTKPGQIKIPDVCDNMGVRCITDFEFLREIGVTFQANR